LLEALALTSSDLKNLRDKIKLVKTHCETLRTKTFLFKDMHKKATRNLENEDQVREMREVDVEALKKMSLEEVKEKVKTEAVM